MVRWVYSEEGQAVAASEFRIYRGTGWADVDYENPVAVVPYVVGQTYMSWRSGDVRSWHAGDVGGAGGDGGRG